MGGIAIIASSSRSRSEFEIALYIEICDRTWNWLWPGPELDNFGTQTMKYFWDPNNEIFLGQTLWKILLCIDVFAGGISRRYLFIACSKLCTFTQKATWGQNSLLVLLMSVYTEVWYNQHISCAWMINSNFWNMLWTAIEYQFYLLVLVSWHGWCDVSFA